MPINIFVARRTRSRKPGMRYTSRIKRQQRGLYLVTSIDVGIREYSVVCVDCILILHRAREEAQKRAAEKCKKKNRSVSLASLSQTISPLLIYYLAFKDTFRGKGRAVPLCTKAPRILCIYPRYGD